MTIYYAESMNLTIKIFCLLLALPLAAADVYRSVDEHGNTVFSDQPTVDSEKIQVRELPVVPGMQNIPPPAPRPTEAQRYRTAAIINPANDETYFRSDGDLVVSVLVEPRLSAADTLVLYLDDMVYASGSSTSFSIAELDRGTHQLRVAIKDVNGNVVKNSETVTFHMRHTSMLHNRPTP